MHSLPYSIHLVGWSLYPKGILRTGTPPRAPRVTRGIPRWMIAPLNKAYGLRLRTVRNAAFGLITRDPRLWHQTVLLASSITTVMMPTIILSVNPTHGPVSITARMQRNLRRLSAQHFLSTSLLFIVRGPMNASA